MLMLWLRCVSTCGCITQVGEQLKRMPGGSGNNPFAQLIEDAEGLDKIEALQVGSLLLCMFAVEPMSWIRSHLPHCFP
jgi:hypothetical protein